MHKTSFYIINGITLYRLLSAPVLLLLLFSKQYEWFKWLLALSFFTDAIDGVLARRFKVTSVLGAKLDSIADDLTVAVGVVGMVVIYPDFIKGQLVWLIALFILFLIEVSFALRRYGKMSSFHTYFAKLSAILQGVFLILLFFLDKPVYFLFYATLVVTALQLIEEIILVALVPEFKTDVKGLYWVMQKKKTGSQSKT